VLNEEFEGVVVAFDSQLSGEFTTAKDVCVCEWELAFGAYEGRAVLSFASVDMYSPCHFQRVPPTPVGCCGVCMDCVVRSYGSSFM
jgi:hypothetical protein